MASGRRGAIAMCLLLCSAQAGAQGNDARRIASTVTYVTVGNVYIGAGRTAGLAVGDTLDLYRAKGLFGRAVITAVSSSSSLASVLGQGVVPAVGDSVAVWKAISAAQEPRSALATPLPVANAGTGTNVVSGRIGLQYSGAGRKGRSPGFLPARDRRPSGCRQALWHVDRIPHERPAGRRYDRALRAIR